ncbi:MAG TPA: GDSL-type esterase/lipase family protein [Tepidisphaeraceae bacterium]|nr:GDSL-type esterase/lipase family protein [Tepidisphaeraceae bacterium]
MSARMIRPVYLLALLALISAPMAFALGAPVSKPARTALSAVTPTEKPVRHYHEFFLYRIHEGPVGLLFLGDSITDIWPTRGQWSWLKFAKYDPADFGVSGDRTENVLWRITHGELDGIHPKVTVILIGTNNLGQLHDEKPEWVAAGIKKIVETVHEKLPETKVLLLGVFPRGDQDSPYRSQIKTINSIISKLDDGNKTRYLDIGNIFLGPDGDIPTENMPDKLHPSPKGYDLWYAAMKPTLDEMMK